MTNREQQALARLIADERQLPLPEADWSRIEARIAARVAQASQPPRKRSHERVYTTLALAAAASVALIAASLIRVEPPASSPRVEAPASITTHEADALNPRGEAEHVEHVGRAHWTLEAGSRARLRQAGKSIVVELESGSIDAEIEPGQAPETFSVEAGDVSVVVHGTQFRVERRGDQVDVSVWEGVVSVSARGEAQALKLPAPAGKRFIQGKLSAQPLPPRSRPLPAPTAALPEEPSIGDVEAGVSRIQAAAQACFAQHTSAKDGVQVSVRSSVLLSVRPDGRVSVQGFDPPLHPSVDGCTRAASAAVRISRSQRGIELTRVLELRR